MKPRTATNTCATCTSPIFRSTKATCSISQKVPTPMTQRRGRSDALASSLTFCNGRGMTWSACGCRSRGLPRKLRWRCSRCCSTTTVSASRTTNLATGPSLSCKCVAVSFTASCSALVSKQCPLGYLACVPTLSFILIHFHPKGSELRIESMQRRPWVAVGCSRLQSVAQGRSGVQRGAEGHNGL